MRHALDCWTPRNNMPWFCKNIKTTSYITQHYIPEGKQLMMFMNILTLISDRSYCLWLLRSAEADAQCHIKKHTIVKVKVILQKAEVAQGVPSSFRIFWRWHHKGGRSSALCTGRLYPTPGHMVPSGATKKIPRHITGDRFRDLPTSSIVP